MPNTYLFDLCTNLLDSATDALAQSRSGNPAPGRRFVTWGAPVADECCEGSGQLTVHLSDDSPAVEHRNVGINTQSNPMTANCAFMPVARMLITLYRCVPVITGRADFPDVDELSYSAKHISQDIWALMTGLYDDSQDGLLFPDADCTSISFGNVTVLPPQGGCAGFVAEVLVTLNDAGPGS